jgi:peptide/nickel transport system substrate-binding protein
MMTRRIRWLAALAVLVVVLAIAAMAHFVQARRTGGPDPEAQAAVSTTVATNHTTLPAATASSSLASRAATPGVASTVAPPLSSTSPPTIPTPPPPTPCCHVEAVVGRPLYINPILAQRGVDLDLVALIFNGLTKVSERSEMMPDLARDWQISPDGLTYTFELRRDVAWHDGTRFTADDVMFTVGAMQDEDYQGPAYVADLWRTVQVEKVHRYSVRFILSEPFAPFLEYTASGMLPAHILAAIPAALLPDQQFNLMPVGTGPYKLAEAHLDQGYLVLEANSAYHDPPRMRQIEFQFYADRATIMVAYDQSAVTGIGGLLPQELATVMSRPSLTLFSAVLSREAFVFFNLANPSTPCLSDPEVRRALLLGLDRQRIINQELAGQGVVAHNVLLPGTWAHNTDAPQYPYDPQRARIVLDEAGWVNPDISRNLSMPADDQTRRREDESLEFSLLVDGANTTHLRIAEEIARQWSVIGAHVEVEPVLERELLESGLYSAALVEWELVPDPDPYPIWHSTQTEGQGQNYTRFQNREADELMEIGRQIPAEDERVQTYSKFQEIWARELPALPLYHPIYNYALDRRIEGVQMGLMLKPCDRFRGVPLWYLDKTEEG